MTIHIYALCNDYLGCFDAPMFRQESEADIQEGLRRSILTDPDGAYKNFAHEKALFYLGEYDDITGIIKPIEQPKKILALAKLFPPGYLAKKEALAAQQDGGQVN